MAGNAVRSAWRNFTDWRSVSDSAKVFAVASALCGVAAWQVLNRPAKREGHDAFSSEKPAVLRGETSRSLEAEKSKMTQ